MTSNQLIVIGRSRRFARTESSPHEGTKSAIGRPNGRTSECANGKTTSRKPGAHTLNVIVFNHGRIMARRLNPSLTKRGLEVGVFEDPTAALARPRAVTFDILVTNLQRRDVDGIQLVGHIVEHCRHTSGILLSSHATLQLARLVLLEGLFHVLANLFDRRDSGAMINFEHKLKPTDKTARTSKAKSRCEPVAHRTSTLRRCLRPQQMVMNLLRKILDATPAGGRLTTSYPAG